MGCDRCSAANEPGSAARSHYSPLAGSGQGWGQFRSDVCASSCALPQPSPVKGSEKG